jgi:biotin carboxyl carrier protein
MATMIVRATLRGAHADLQQPLVVDPGTAADGKHPPARLERHDLGRVTFRTVDEGGVPARHQVLLGDEGPHTVAARQVEVVVDGWRFEVEIEPEARAALREKARRDRGESGQSGPAEVRAIIPGVVVSVAVAQGDEVKAGQQLLVVEAMKMQNELRAPRAGTIERVDVGERATIEVGDLLVVIR